MKYLIINNSGKQFYFTPGRWEEIDLLKKKKNDYLKKGDYFLLKRILLYRTATKLQIGKPFLENAKVIGKILEIGKKKKITVLKTKPKKNYTRVRGHRQKYMRIQLENF